ncbi:Nucleotidyltransferase domain-containing protein [Caldanaerobius fijiensis DSM 17918]|uniref:Nucleotidyltransferase domain-containing protein n=1 Tax=Caldanaerobius fijiensis DSM 17918 TaxID=1121256 RepID=A0A1M4SX90_9THEO|nr:nucleotidyltransferase domain-containing protein [Caldanaerobius fijiensis]SHE36805.1 Nucleotidyltransferase domain-containing protein [Caldanaerobius fijiensis DSM 17918]
MAQYSWFNCPENVHNQINGLLKDVKCCLKDNMVGIYLHGSLAMGCFNPEISDIDILVIIEQNLDDILEVQKKTCKKGEDINV